MKIKYDTCDEAYEIYFGRKKKKFLKNKTNRELTRTEKILIRCAFKAGWEYCNSLRLKGDEEK